MRLFLAIAAVLAWMFGGALILVPARFYAHTGISLKSRTARCESW